MRLTISLCFALTALLLDPQRGVLAEDSHSSGDHPSDSDHSDDHSSDSSGDHASDSAHSSDHSSESSGDHSGDHSSEASGDHSDDHADDHADDHSADVASSCMGMLGSAHPMELPGLNHSEGKYPGVFLSRCTWKPVTMLDVTTTEDGPMFGTTQFGYSTLIGDNGFPQYYQLQKVLLTKPKHTVDHMHYNFELQVASLKQNTVWDFDENDMVVTSFFFEVAKETVGPEEDKSSPLIQQVLDGHNLHGNQITERAGVDLQRAMGPQLKGDFYVYKTSSDHCASATWYVFTKPIRMSLAQKEELESIYPGLATGAESGHHSAAQKPAMCMKNTFLEGTPVHYDFYLDRDTGRNRAPKGEYLILVPIFGTILLASAVMSSVFVSDTKDDSLGAITAKGMMPSVIGSPSSYP